MSIERWTSRTRRIAIICCFASLATVGSFATGYGQQPDGSPPPAPVLGKTAPDAVSEQYIVILKPGLSPLARKSLEARVTSIGGKIIASFGKAINGFSVQISDANLEKLRLFTEIEHIEADRNTKPQYSIQLAPSAGLDRIDQRLLPRDWVFQYSETGAGVHVYVMDTGIFAPNVDFEGRVDTVKSFDAIMDGNGTNDCNGHGTNVAGIIGGKTFGVAKRATLHAVRVINCDGIGTHTQMIAGIEWIISNATRPAVVNVSLDSSAFAPVDTAVQNAIASGITFVISAGNYGEDACNFSPARVPQAITVGNVDPNNDKRNTDGPVPSNYGSCIKIFAPGVAILSTGNSGPTGTSDYTGTSQAAPHVAGVAALFLQYHPSASPAAVWDAIKSAADNMATPGWNGVQNAGAGSPNLLLHWAATSDGSHNGDPHTVTVGGVHYDFQGAGEFVALRDGGNFQVQVRQKPISTGAMVADDYSGLRACISVTSAVAVATNGHRITFEGDKLGGSPAMLVRIDGAPVNANNNRITVPGGGEISRYKGEGTYQVIEPAGRVYLAYWWWPAQQTWMFNVTVKGTKGSEGLMGQLAYQSWLPALPDGTPLGPKPVSLHDRYLELYDRFSNAWRVTDQTALFDYGKGETTGTYTVKGWPPENGPCTTPGSPRAEPLPAERAAKICSRIGDASQKANCIFDVSITGEERFAAVYRNSQ